MADKQAIMMALKEAMASGGGAPATSKRPMARPNMIGASPSGGTRGIDPAENYSPEGLKRLLNQGMGMMGESGKTISDADKMRIMNMLRKKPAGMMRGGKVQGYEDGGAVRKKKPKNGCVMKGRGGKYKGTK